MPSETAVAEASAALAQAVEAPEPPLPEIAPMNGTRFNLHQRINAVKQVVRYVRKTKLIGKEGSSYAYNAIERDEVMALLNPFLTRHGINVAVSFISGETKDSGTFTGNGVPIVRFEAVFDVSLINVDAPEDRFTQRVSAHALDQGDKAPGKAATYAEKTALIKGFSLETGIDDESRYDAIGPTPPTPERVRPAAKAEPQKEEPQVTGKAPAKAAEKAAEKAPAKAPEKVPEKKAEKAAEPAQNAPPGDPPPVSATEGDTRKISAGQVKFLQIKMKGLARNDKHAEELWAATLARYQVAKLEDVTVDQASQIKDMIVQCLKAAEGGDKQGQA